MAEGSGCAGRTRRVWILSRRASRSSGDGKPFTPWHRLMAGDRQPGFPDAVAFRGSVIGSGGGRFDFPPGLITGCFRLVGWTFLPTTGSAAENSILQKNQIARLRLVPSRRRFRGLFAAPKTGISSICPQRHAVIGIDARSLGREDAKGAPKPTRITDCLESISP
jgi:hypothetical protein